MNVYKKLGAMTLAIVLAFALCVPAFAAGGDMKGDGSEDGVLGEFSAVNAVKATYSPQEVLLYKELTVFNENESTVNAPTITYKYTIAPVEDSNPLLNITDKFGVKVDVKEGASGATISGSVDNGTIYKTGELAFTPSVSLAANNTTGEKNVFPLKVDFSGVTWTGAGVYRYKIQEFVGDSFTDDDDTNTAKNAAGIHDGTISSVRYLDVYVKDSETAGQYEIYGFVCFQKTPVSIDGTLTDGSASTKNNVVAIAKTEGFVADKDTSGETDLTADQYYTFNLTVGKNLENDQSQNDHDFPFHVNFLNSSVTADIVIITKTTENKSASPTPTPTTGALSSGKLSAITTGIADNPSIDDDSIVKYIGIPVGITTATTATVYETNDLPGTTYSTTYKIDTDAESTAQTVLGSTNSQTATFDNKLTADAANTTAHSVTFTNTLLNISPTGVTLRYAPYLLTLGAGVVALPLSRSFKRREDF